MEIWDLNSNEIFISFVGTLKQQSEELGLNKKSFELKKSGGKAKMFYQCNQ